MAYLLPQLLLRAADEFPDKVAVVSGSETITYAQLNHASDRLAGVLVAGGVRRGDRVGIFAAKSIGTIVAIHGIMKAGAAYVPIDAGAPAARAAYIIENGGIRCLLTAGRKSTEVSEILDTGVGVEHLILLDGVALEGKSPASVTPWRDVLAFEGVCRDPGAVEDDLAYILYTSGSTGVPKGVMISHRNALTFVDWAHGEIGVTSADRLSSHAPLHFDLSIFDVFVAMKAGATIHLVPEGLSAFPFRLAEWIETSGISIWYSVPTILSLLIRSGGLDRFEFGNLHTIIFAGEVFPVKFLRDLMTAVPRASYYNFYGPTETNVITYYAVPVLPADRTAPIPIGKSCANTEVFALTDEGEVVTRAGDVGELYARGPGVARGYWADPEKTERNFVENPRSRGYRETVYRTGDIVTLDDEGDYLFLGRRDDMVKSRGYRIELGEVESALYGHSSVREAAVVAVVDASIGNRLVAFVVREAGANVDAAGLQSFCSRRIPRYMVPEQVEFREELPRTSTGKIDKVVLARSAADVAHGSTNTPAESE